MRVFLVRVAVVIALLLPAAGCGKRGIPLPPEPRGPFAPGDVELRQIGGSVLVSFEPPAPRSRSKPSQSVTRAFLVRVELEDRGDAPDPDRFHRRGETIRKVDLDPEAAGSRVTLVDPFSEDRIRSAGWFWYGVRVEDRRGRSSPLVVAGSIRPVRPPVRPPAPRTEMTAEGVRLRWAAERSGKEKQPVNIYRSLLGRKTGRRPINDSPIAGGEYLDTAVEVGETYRYVLRTVAGRNPFQESESSPPAEVHAVDLFPPVPPTRPVAVQEGAAVRLFWDPNQEKDLAGYRIYRKVGDGEWKALPGNLITGTSWVDQDVSAGNRVAYRVTALDRAKPPNESGYSEEVSVLIALDPNAPGGAGR